jgi:hypothetical protein
VSALRHALERGHVVRVRVPLAAQAVEVKDPRDEQHGRESEPVPVRVDRQRNAALGRRLAVFIHPFRDHACYLSERLNDGSMRATEVVGSDSASPARL